MDWIKAVGVDLARLFNEEITRVLAVYTTKQKTSEMP